MKKHHLGLHSLEIWIFSKILWQKTLTTHIASFIWSPESSILWLHFYDKCDNCMFILQNRNFLERRIGAFIWILEIRINNFCFVFFLFSYFVMLAPINSESEKDWTLALLLLIWIRSSSEFWCSLSILMTCNCEQCN